MLNSIRVVVLFVACILATAIGCDREASTGDRLFLESQHPKSKRYAIVEDNGTSCWLYLTAPNQNRPEKDCFVYSPIEPADELNIDDIRDNGTSPILTIAVASETATMVNPDPDSFLIRWSEEGQSVVVEHKGIPVAMIAKDRERGLSKALEISSFFGEPWDQSLYEELFRRD